MASSPSTVRLRREAASGGRPTDYTVALAWAYVVIATAATAAFALLGGCSSGLRYTPAPVCKVQSVSEPPNLDPKDTPDGGIALSRGDALALIAFIEELNLFVDTVKQCPSVEVKDH